MTGSTALDLLLFAGGFVITIGFVALLFRLGRFEATPREKRVWPALVAVVAVEGVILAVVQPLQNVPIGVPLAANGVLAVVFVWMWRTGRLALERQPADLRPEMARRRRWFGEHRVLLVGLWAACTATIVAWALVVLLLFVRR